MRLTPVEAVLIHRPGVYDEKMPTTLLCLPLAVGKHATASLLHSDAANYTTAGTLSSYHYAHNAICSAVIAPVGILLAWLLGYQRYLSKPHVVMCKSSVPILQVGSNIN